MFPRLLLAFAVFLSTLAASNSPARAQDAPPPPADPRVSSARAACAEGRVEDGVRGLAELHAATDEPLWIFNQGRCYQQNGRAAEAIERFHVFLEQVQRAPRDELHEEAILAARRHLAALEGRPPPAPAAPPVVPAPPPAPPVVVTEAPPPPAPAAPAASGYRVAALACAAVGAAGLATGLGFGLATRSKERSVQTRADGALTGLDQAELAGDLRAGRRYQTLQWVGYAAGAAALATGAVLWLVADARARRESPPRAALLLPTAGHACAGATLWVRF
jgi:hypothetical protein